MTASDQLAEAAKNVLADWEESRMVCESRLFDPLRDALAAYDAGRELREAERGFLDAAELWSQTIIAKLQGTYPSEVVRRLERFLAARKAAEVKHV